MKSLSHIVEQSFLVDRYSEQAQIPCVVVFRKDWHKVTPEITKVAMAHNPLFTLKVAENWAELGAVHDMHPALLIFHMGMADEYNITLTEFVAMLHTMCKMVPGCNVKIAVSVEKQCTPALLKEIKNSSVDGIVPAISTYGIEKSMNAIAELLHGKQHWPKDVMDEILNVKKPVKVLDNSIHLTVRQQQVMDLVCHRGLPNKTIANMLHITESTVKIHVSAILKEYGVRNRTQLALAARDALHD